MNRKGPPPRPPAPKIGIGGFSFKALEEEDDEDLTKFTGEFDKQVQREKQAREVSHVERSDSKVLHRTGSVGSADGEKSPLQARQNSFDRITKDIKEKITKKIEEFSLDSSPTKMEDEKESAFSKNSMNESQNSLEDAFAPKSTGGGIITSTTLEDEPETEYFEAVNGEEESHSKEEEDLDIVDEYYNPETAHFTELPGVVSPVRQRKRFQKHRKISPVIPPAPVMMSHLSKKLPDYGADQGTCVDTGKPSTDKPKTELPRPSSIHQISNKVTYLPVRKLVGSILFLFLYMVIPLPSYISGIIAGMLIASAGWVLYLWINQPPKPREPIPEDLPLDKLPPLPIPEVKEPKGDDGCYKGWMNESLDYNPDTYSINQTFSVYIHLEGTTLRLRRPKNNIPKRAMWDEPNPQPTFVHQKHFDIEGSKILLLPPELVKKRLWSKKYPICIALAKDGRKHSETTDSEATTSSKMSTSSSSDSVHGFEIITEQKCDKSVLYLFARTTREKEEWYKRFTAAAKGNPLKNHVLEIRRILNDTNRHKRSRSLESMGRHHKRQESTDSTSSGTPSPSTEQQQFLTENDLGPFVRFMSRLMPRDRDSLPSSPAHTGSLKDGKISDTKPVHRGIICDPVLIPFNALLGRCFWDFLKDKYWSEKVQEKLQKKLSKIHIPYFIEELQISAIDLGNEVPVIRRANNPYMDEMGLWVDLDVTYSGKFKMTIETKVNLLKLKKASSRQHVEHSGGKKSAVTDEEEEDSAESSTDEEEEAGINPEESGAGQGGGAGRKIMKYINKIAASKYFQSAAENKYIKKAMTEVSNTPLTLNVEVQKLNGTLAINIPPPPTDRLWYGFRGNPKLWLVAKPKVGEREVTMSHITEWIEKKLAVEFQHVLVMPNMDDIIIPILLPPSDLSSTMPRSSSGSEV